MRLSLGQRVMATLPPEMAYGNQVVRGVIPENSTLVFDIELIDFKS